MDGSAWRPRALLRSPGRECLYSHPSSRSSPRELALAPGLPPSGRRLIADGSAQSRCSVNFLAERVVGGRSRPAQEDQPLVSASPDGLWGPRPRPRASPCGLQPASAPASLPPLLAPGHSSLSPRSFQTSGSVGLLCLRCLGQHCPTPRPQADPTRPPSPSASVPFPVAPWRPPNCHSRVISPALTPLELSVWTPQHPVHLSHSPPGHQRLERKALSSLLCVLVPVDGEGPVDGGGTCGRRGTCAQGRDQWMGGTCGCLRGMSGEWLLVMLGCVAWGRGMPALA